MGVLLNRTYVQAASTNLATDLARYGSDAQWRGVYYRGEKIGFTVSQIVPTDDGFELQEDGRLQMSLMGAASAATIRTTAQVDSAFSLRSFEFSLDPGTGPITIKGRTEPAASGTRLIVSITTSGGTRTETRDLAEPPVLPLNFSRRLASGGLKPGSRHQFTILDPATLTNAPVTVAIGPREIVRTAEQRVPAFKVEMEFAGYHTTSWVSDTGEVVREESPMGLMTVRESSARAKTLAVPARIRADLLESSAIVPDMNRWHIDDPRFVRRIRLRLSGVDMSNPELSGAGQTVAKDSIEVIDPQTLQPAAFDRDALTYLAPEPLIESDAPEILAEAEKAVQGITGARARAERLTRHVNAILQKKPTVSLPSAREVLRTKVGDCNEHTALYVAMARALGIPARIAVGVVYIHGAFYYHAWPEVYVADTKTTGLWLPVDPTLNQFPADATHLRLARGGLQKQAAILPLIGKMQIEVEDLELAPNTTPILVGRQPTDISPLAIEIPRREAGGCWSVSRR